jgi:hypothetical protein
VARVDPASFPPVPVPRDQPPPGYNGFYGWHNGIFHGLNVTDPAELAKYRAEGRWFDKHGREIPKYKADGSYNCYGGNLSFDGHADPYQAEIEKESEAKRANDIRSLCERNYSTPDQIWNCVEYNLRLRGKPNFYNGSTTKQ